jgi:hypothetical protein
MYHHNLTGDKIQEQCHYGVSVSASINSKPRYVLAQIQDEDGDQARIRMNRDEAIHFANLLLEAAEKVSPLNNENKQQPNSNGQ